MSKTMRCPNCGNYVEGKKIKSYSDKVARQGAKSLVHGAISVGAQQQVLPNWRHRLKHLSLPKMSKNISTCIVNMPMRVK